MDGERETDATAPNNLCSPAPSLSKVAEVSKGIMFGLLDHTRVHPHPHSTRHPHGHTSLWHPHSHTSLWHPHVHAHPHHALVGGHTHPHAHSHSNSRLHHRIYGRSDCCGSKAHI